MASTTPTHVDSSIPEVWAKGTLRDALRAAFFSRFVGEEGSGAPIIRKTELLNKPGDLIHIQVTGPLTGAGVTGDTTALTGSEENLTTSEIKASPLLYRHAVRVYRRANKKSILDLRGEARMRLAEWGAEKIDDVTFANMVASVLPAPLGAEAYAPNFRIVGTAGANTGTIDDLIATETLSVVELQKAKLTLYNNRARPVKVDGRDAFIAVVHPNALYDLKREAEYRDWVREAAVRGADNPFFRGATAMIDGIVLFEHSNVPTQVNAGAVKCAKNVVMGAEAAVIAADEDTSWAEETFDYGNEFGIAHSFAFQPRRALEKNSLQLLSAAVDK